MSIIFLIKFLSKLTVWCYGYTLNKEIDFSDPGLGQSHLPQRKAVRYGQEQA